MHAPNISQTFFALALGLFLLGAWGMASAQISMSTFTVLNTGIGGAAVADMLLLGASAVVSLVGAVYLLRSKQKMSSHGGGG